MVRPAKSMLLQSVLAFAFAASGVLSAPTDETQILPRQVKNPGQLPRNVLRVFTDKNYFGKSEDTDVNWPLRACCM